MTNDEILKLYSSNDLHFEGVTGGTLFHHRRILSDGELLFLVNSSTAMPLTGSLITKGADAFELNTLTGDIYGYSNTKTGNDINCSFSLPTGR